MYFSIGKHPNLLFKYHKKIGALILSTEYDKNYHGYKLGKFGGNFCEFLEGTINFSFHKDFKLYTNDDVILTNLEINGRELPSNIVSFDILTQEYLQHNLDSFPELSYETVTIEVYNILLENLKTCALLTDPKIVYTAGLDSSTLAYIAHANKIDFTCLIDLRLKDRLKNLPFKNIKYVECQRLPDFKILHGPTNNIKEGFYQFENNKLITGYFGDNCIVHNSDMFHQSKQLHKNYSSIFVYDKKPPANYVLFNNKQEIVNGITYINSQNYFRHWFDSFEILDPYRDPRLPNTVIKLCLNDLIVQIGSAQLQKDIIKILNPNWLNNLCEYKNDYGKF